MRSRRYEEIEIALTGLEAAWNQARVLLWEVRSGEAHLVSTCRCRESDFEDALAMWRTKWRRLQSGFSVHEHDAVYHPVRTQDGRLLAFVQAVAGASAENQEPEVQAYVECKLRALGASLAGPAVDPEPEFDEPEPAGAVAGARRSKLAPAVMVLATDDSQETVRSKTVAALVRCGWNVSKAARVLGITRQSVWRRMQRHVIPRPSPSPFDPRPSRA